MVLPQLSQAEALNVWDYTTILNQLTRVYDNPNKVQEAEDKLLSLKQGTDSVPAYVAKFERVLYEASGQNWPDVNKISTFRNGLNSTIRSRLSQQLSLPRKYPDFVKVVQQLAGRSSHAPTSANAIGNHTGNHHSEPMELGAINAIQSTQLIFLALNLHSLPQQGSAHDLYPQPAENNTDWKDAVYAVDHSITGLEVVHLLPHKKQTAKRIPASDQGSDESDLDIDYEIERIRRGEV